jgi:hypothetical protein
LAVGSHAPYPETVKHTISSGLLAVIVALLAACIPNTVAPPASSSPAAAGSASSAVEEPSASPEASVEPASEEPPASVAPAESAGPAASESGAPASTGPGPAAACSGTDKNREFFASAAAAVKWTVYCAVLPTGWFVDSGTYRGSGGGWLQIAYKGPSGARFELREGAFCTTPDGCVPAGTDAGSASLGDRSGTLVKLDSGGWAVVVDRGQPISWLAVGTGMDQTTFQRLAGALATVGG